MNIPQPEPGKVCHLAWHPSTDGKSVARKRLTVGEMNGVRLFGTHGRGSFGLKASSFLPSASAAPLEIGQIRLHARGAFAKLPVIAPEILLCLWLCIAVMPTVTATPTFDAIAVTLLCPLVVMLLIRSDHKTPAFAGTQGALSYPLYTVHPGIVLLAQGTPLFGLNRGPDPWRAVGVVMLCIAAAWAIHVLTGARRPRAAATTQSA